MTTPRQEKGAKVAMNPASSGDPARNNDRDGSAASSPVAGPASGHVSGTQSPYAQLGLFDSVFQEVDEAIAIVQTRNGSSPVVVDVNSRFEQEVGYRLGEVRGQSLFRVIRVPDDRESAEITALKCALRERKAAQVVVTLHTKEKVAVPVRLKLRPCSTAGDDSKFVCFLRSEQEAEEERLAARTITNRLLTFLSHDLRTPLNGILGFSEIMMSGMLEGLDRADYEAYARDIHSAGQDLLRLVNGLLDLSHSQTMGLELCDHLFPVAAWIEAGLATAQPKADKAGISLTASIEDALPLLRGDEARLRQVLMILLANAIKFTPRGGSIHVSAARCARGLEVRVADTGIGIAEHELACAFLPYRRIEDTYTNPKAGIGVGLPLVKVLVEQHGGSVAIESRRGDGTTVILRLPPERLTAA
ncbi:MAG: PAS domain-containing sensor histidine kinase [Alphaproteobacteria bacterium]|nr:MAG: PAS domain-containing sensor histidine kinase [Alphaproteobacteria bacterium]